MLPAVLLCCSADGVAARSEGRFRDPEGRYSFAPPPGWKLKTGLPSPIVAFIGPEENGFAVNFMVNIYSRPVKSDEEVAFVRSIKVQHGALYALKRTTLGGYPAHCWRTHLRVPKFPELENRQIVCFHENRAYELTFTMTPSAKRRYDPVFDRVVASFRWEKPESDTPTRKENGKS